MVMVNHFILLISFCVQRILKRLQSLQLSCPVCVCWSPESALTAMGRSEGPLRVVVRTLMLLALCHRPATASTTPSPSPPMPDGRLDQLSEQGPSLWEQLEAADDGGNGSAAGTEATTTGERRRQCSELSARSLPPASHCHVTWDEALCWPESPPDTLVRLDCFEELRGIIYPGDRNSKCRTRRRCCMPCIIYCALCTCAVLGAALAAHKQCHSSVMSTFFQAISSMRTPRQSGRLTECSVSWRWSKPFACPSDKL